MHGCVNMDVHSSAPKVLLNPHHAVKEGVLCLQKTGGNRGFQGLWRKLQNIFTLGR